MISKLRKKLKLDIDILFGAGNEDVNSSTYELKKPANKPLATRHKTVFYLNIVKHISYGDFNCIK